jgi:hypothetical protein
MQNGAPRTKKALPGAFFPAWLVAPDVRAAVLSSHQVRRKRDSKIRMSFNAPTWANRAVAGIFPA